jgi:hypothetical protein
MVIVLDTPKARVRCKTHRKQALLSLVLQQVVQGVVQLVMQQRLQHHAAGR